MSFNKWECNLDLFIIHKYLEQNLQCLNLHVCMVSVPPPLFPSNSDSLLVIKTLI